MSSPSKETEEPTSTNDIVSNGAGGSKDATPAAAASEPQLQPRPPAKRRLSGTAVIEISDTESDDSDICAVTSYQASADEVKRIRGDYSSTSSSSSDYSSDSESPWEDDSVIAEEAPLGRRLPLPHAQLNPRADRFTDPKLNAAIQSQEVIDKLTSHWQSSTDHHSSEVTLTCEPFRLCLLHDLLADPDVINNIVDDMNTLDWSRKKMDLYEFHQTTDLASLTWQRGIKGIYEMLKTDVMSLVAKVTGLELTTISASCSLYGPGDHLLPHDDLLGDRRVAFILYLAPWKAPMCSYSAQPGLDVPNENGDHVDVDECSGGWAAHMGGALQLFDRDASGRPSKVVKSVLPRNNALAFFQVGVDSFHQVEEVVSLELPRLSINGWFHGPAPASEAEADPESEAEPVAPPEPVKPHNDVVVIQQWIEATYMSPRVRAQVQAQMERDSELCLEGFLHTNKRKELLEALEKPDVEWEEVGPANQRRYERVSAAWAERERAKVAGDTDGGTEGVSVGEGHVVSALLHLLSSATFCRMLKDCTDLTLGHVERVELQRWRPGDFTLLPPRSHYEKPRLEAVLYLGTPAHLWCGGSTCVVAPEEPQPDGGALVTIPPADNALSLVYCDSGAAAFTKYVSKITLRPEQHFFLVACTYRE